MKSILILFIVIHMLLPAQLHAACSRIATINYQKILVDAGTDKKGEGLRFYLEKDPQSKILLDKYQKENQPTFLKASTSTIGSILLLTGLLQPNESSGIQNKNTLMYGGAFLIALSYLTSKTLQYSNEKYLEQAVDQYNKRNSPRIYFSPYKENNKKTGIGFGFSQEF